MTEEEFKTGQMADGTRLMQPAASTKGFAEKLDEVTKVAIDPGNAHSSHYMRGMANGLILAQAVFNDVEPTYIEADVVRDFDYIAEARLTCSPAWHGAKVSKANFAQRLNAAIDAANRLDQVKKTLFYGRDNNLDPVEGQASVESLPEAFGMNAHAPTHIDIMHGIIGLFTEAGELLEAMRDAINEGRPFDFVNLKEEVGDGFWYQAIIASRSGFTFDEAMRVNIAKLRARFPDRFTEFDANNRNLVGEREILEGGSLGVSLGVDPVVDVDAGRDIADQALPLHHRQRRFEGERNLDGDAIEAQKPT